MMENTPLLTNWLELAIDAALIVAVLLLWLSWYRNGQRQKQLEQLLKETAAQLQEATAHLSTASSVIEQIKRNPEPTPMKRAAPPDTQDSAPRNSSQATMILRMHREGESAATIADRLDLPLAQVKLLLKLHTADVTKQNN